MGISELRRKLDAVAKAMNDAPVTMTDRSMIIPASKAYPVYGIWPSVIHDNPRTRMITLTGPQGVERGR